ncbi:HD domain-containing protein [Candidatus Methanodesulfokora washburnensis]|uniref:HD domain-containing protein n=2 Tax=Candidatus Methanodesulfokora washburnensis TaxID=2478471 RepID=A0A3R9R1F7_9CREN|nr:HD domain-containing protein [Candidatus Methanodesulfokores washburnensis]
MHMAGLIAETLKDLGVDVVQLSRLQGLLHDVGHGPFSHTFEPVLERICGLSHEEMTQKIVKETEISDVLSKNGFDPTEVADYSIGRGKIRYQNQIIRSPFDADKLDFTMRDSYHTGAGYYVDAYRIAYNVGIIDNSLGLNIKALPTLESLLISRLLSFRSIYFHKTSRAAQVMLTRAMEIVADRLEVEEAAKDVEKYIQLDDYTVWNVIRSDPRTKSIFEDLANRRLLKVAYEDILYRREGDLSLLERKSVIEGIRDEIANRSGVPREEIYVDTPLLRTLPMEDMSLEVLFFSSEGGEIKRLNAEEISPIIYQLRRTVMSTLRVYTRRENVEKVKKAAEEVFRGGSSFYYRVSY